MDEVTFRARTRAEANLRIWNAFIGRTYPIVRRMPKPAVPKDSDLSIVIIEPRIHSHLEYVLRNALYFLGPEWGLQVFAGRRNHAFVRELTQGWGQVRIELLEVDDLDTRGYNQMKKSLAFWQRVHAEQILWLEPDCILRRRGIGEFLQFDYIGAPWSQSAAVSPNCRVGNGGLSMRSKSAMIKIASVANTDPALFVPEDVFFCVNMSLCNLQTPGSFALADFTQANRFAVEAVFHPDPLGLHKIWKYLSTGQVNHLLSTIEY